MSLQEGVEDGSGCALRPTSKHLKGGWGALDVLPYHLQEERSFSLSEESSCQGEESTTNLQDAMAVLGEKLVVSVLRKQENDEDGLQEAEV